MRKERPALYCGIVTTSIAALLLATACASTDPTPPVGSGGSSGGSGVGGASGSGTGGAVAGGSGGSSAGVSGAGGSGGSGVGSGGAGASSGGSSGMGGNPNGGTTSGAGGIANAGSGGMTAGAAGKAGSGGVAGSGGGSACPATAKLCDDFEGPGVGQPGSAWTAEGKAPSTIAVDTTKPHRGAKSVHIDYKGQQGFISETQTFTAGAAKPMNDEMWGRMFVWFEVASGTTQGHFVFIRAQGTAQAPNTDGQLHIAGGYQTRFAAEIRTTTDLYRYATPDRVIPQTPVKWECWEWHTTGNNTLDFYIDSTLVSGMSVTAANNWPFPNFNKLYLGFLQFSAMPTGQMWIDDVVLDTTQIGCDI